VGRISLRIDNLAWSDPNNNPNKQITLLLKKNVLTSPHFGVFIDHDTQVYRVISGLRFSHLFRRRGGWKEIQKAWRSHWWSQALFFGREDEIDQSHPHFDLGYFQFLSDPRVSLSHIG
jgi:hypothetical protein